MEILCKIRDYRGFVIGFVVDNNGKKELCSYRKAEVLIERKYISNAILLINGRIRSKKGKFIEVKYEDVGSYLHVRSKASLIRKVDEKTTRGMLSKAWYNIGDGVYLVKGNSFENKHIGYEPYSEVIASRLALRLGFESIEYTLADAEEFSEVVVYGVKHVSVCRSFINSNDVRLVPFEKYANMVIGKNISDYWGFVHRIFNDESIRFIYDMLLFDMIIGNKDRHLNNWDVMRGKDYTRFAPLIDFGASLLSWDTDVTVRKVCDLHGDSIGPDTSKPFRENHISQLMLLLKYAKKIGVVPNLIKNKGIIKREVEFVINNSEDIFMHLSKYRSEAIKNYLRLRALRFVKIVG
jgi:hypothetical protein